MNSNSYPLYLASKSPRRRKLLKLIYPDIHLIDVETDEFFIPDEKPVITVKRIAIEKMEAALPKVKNGIILTADTIVVFNGQIIGKPKDTEDAFRILKLLSGQAHYVYTGLCLHLMPENKRITSYEKTKVLFRELTDKEITKYIASGSPMDKAGAYGIQDDYGAVFVRKIVGCYYNVVGLPMTKTHLLLGELLQHV